MIFIAFFCYKCVSEGTLLHIDDSKTILSGCSSDLNGEVVIPRSVVTIFKNCANTINALRFEEGSQINYIQSKSFRQTSLITVNFSECKNLLQLNSSIFDHCSSLEKVILPPFLIEIRDYCFSWTKIQNIEFPNTLKHIGSDAFFFSQLIEINIPDSLEVIEYDVFSYTNLRVINISPNSNLTRIKSNTFGKLHISEFYIPRNLENIDNNAGFEIKFDKITVHPENQNFKSDNVSLYIGNNNNTLFRVAVSYKGRRV